MQFNFRPNFVQWFRTLHSNISSCLLNNGHASIFFSIKRGVRQGCPLSGLLFVIGLELLARAIKCDALIKGNVINIGKEEIKIPCMRTTPLFFVQDTESILQLLHMLEKFRSISCLQVNTSKNRGYVAGLLERQARYPFQLQMARRAYLHVRCLLLV